MPRGKIKRGYVVSIIVVAWLIVLVAIPLALAAYRARRPSDMPVTSVWIDAPAVPFGFYRGWWLGCWVDTDQQADRCRLYSGSLHPPVVYEGRYVPCEGKSPVPLTELKLKPPADSSDMWLFTRMIVFLEDGRLLVPVENAGECEMIRQRLSKSRDSQWR